jgi:hypothetical protein
LRVLPDPATLGLTEPNAAERRYRHGTLSGYNAGKCRCSTCRDAFAIYRAERRAAQRDEPRRLRTVDTDGHIPRDWFRLNVWQSALEKANIPFRVRPHAFAMLTPHGFSLEARTFRSSKNDSGIAASPRRRSTSTRCPRPIKAVAAARVFWPPTAATADGNGKHAPAPVGMGAPGSAAVMHLPDPPADGGQANCPDAGADVGARLLHDASAIYQTAAALGQRLSQRALARQLRGRGHRFPNQHLRGIAATVGLPSAPRASVNGR